MLSERVSEIAEAAPRLSPTSAGSSGIPLSNIPHKPFHRPGFPVEYQSIPSPANCQPYSTSPAERPSFVPSPVDRSSYAPSPADRQSYPTSPSSPCSTTSEHDSSLEKQLPMDSDNSDDGDKDVYSRTEYYRNPNTDNNGEFIYLFIYLYYSSQSHCSYFNEIHVLKTSKRFRSAC